MRQRIMAIDANLPMLDLYGEFLIGEGYEVSVCHEGAGVCERVREVMPDAIILDTHLPAPMTGWQVLALLGADPLLRDIPVLMTSTLRFPAQDPDDILVPRWAAMVAKPFDLDILLTTLRHMLLDNPVQPGAVAG